MPLGRYLAPLALGLVACGEQGPGIYSENLGVASKPEPAPPNVSSFSSIAALHAELARINAKGPAPDPLKESYASPLNNPDHRIAVSAVPRASTPPLERWNGYLVTVLLDDSGSTRADRPPLFAYGLADSVEDAAELSDYLQQEIADGENGGPVDKVRATGRLVSGRLSITEIEVDGKPFRLK